MRLHVGLPVSLDRFPIERVPPQVREIAAVLATAGFEAWYVGGAVRDELFKALRGRSPKRTGDFDIATTALPEQVRRLFRRTVPVGIEHGTVAVLDEQDVAHEVTTFRRDVKTDGRHAVVEFGASLDDDLARRDFSINAVAVHPTTGEVRDPFGGRDDLARGVLRAVGDAATRFLEDRLRVLRALRLASAFEFEIEPSTWDAAVAAAGELEHLSRERVRDEWLKTLATSRPTAGLGLWRRAGALAAVWPELASLSPDQDRSLESLGLDDPVLITAAALSLAGASAGAAEVAARRLKLPGRDAERVRGIVTGLAEGLPPAGGEPLRRWLARHRGFAEDILAASPPGQPRDAVRLAMQEALEAGVPLSVHQLAIGGDELRAEGIPPGPKMGEILRRLLDEVLAVPERNTPQWLLARARELA